VNKYEISEVDLFAAEPTDISTETLPDASAPINTYGTASTFGTASSSTKGSAACMGSLG